ncbi:hypothetical protein ABEB36_012398 [Hypothenemus hampei]|uniref:Uncharacterized protein n=1 Tax=Hypothenemus hampei TaxID=57062 RepID=A0ABD1EDS1_HYPHA
MSGSNIYCNNECEIIQELMDTSDITGSENIDSVIEKPVIIIGQEKQKFRCHSYMEADSMHSAIEHAKRHIPVFCMNDWKTIMTMARSKRGKNKISGAYTVQQLTFNDFIDSKDLSNSIIKNATRDEDGKKVQWLKIKQLRYEKKSSVIMFRNNYDEEYKIINVKSKARGSNIPKEKDLKKCYSERLPISEKKKKDLLKLCKTGVIPYEYHSWYMNLPSNGSVIDKCPEPAQSDEEV